MSEIANVRNLAFVIVDPDGTVVEANARAEALFGVPTLIGHPVAALLPDPPDPQGSGARHALRSDGATVPVLVTAIPIGPRRGYGIVDLRDPNEVRETFSASTSLASRVLDQLGTAVVIQVGAEIVSANPSAARTLGMTLDELLGRTSIDPRWRAVNEDGSPLAGEDHPAMVVLRTGSPCSRIMGIHTPDGELRWIDATARPLVTDAGRVVATFAEFNDISAQRRAEDERSAALVRYETLLTEASDAVLEVGPEGTIRYASPSSGPTLGRITDALPGTTLLALAVTDDRPALAHALEQSAARPASHVALTIRIDARGGDRWFEVRLRNATDVPEVGAIVATLADVHERVDAVERLRAVNIELEQRLNERDEEYRVDHELSVAAELLGHCDDDLEIQAVLWNAATAVFRGANVTLLRRRPGTSALDVVGAAGPTRRAFDADECWALRTQRVHESRPPAGLACEHLAADAPPTICVPLGPSIRPYGLLIVEADGVPVVAHATSIADRLGPLLARLNTPDR